MMRRELVGGLVRLPTGEKAVVRGMTTEGLARVTVRGRIGLAAIRDVSASSLVSIPWEAEPPVVAHDVRGDRVTENGWGRFTCYTDGCEGSTCLKSPFMTPRGWLAAKMEFFATHHVDERDVKGWPR